MKKLAIALMILVASAAAHADKAKAKSKDKQFQPVVRAVADYAGSYSGPSDSYGLVFELAPDGKLRGNYVEMGRVAVLNGIVLKGSDFTARASFDDGSLRKISGSFANRILNGKSAFGARVHDVHVDGMGKVDTFFERVN